MSTTLTSCTDEQVQVTADILTTLALVYTINNYSHRDGPYYYYAVPRAQCNSSYYYYYGSTTVYNNCRYFDAWGGYYIYNTTRYNSIGIYRRR